MNGACTNALNFDEEIYDDRIINHRLHIGETLREKGYIRKNLTNCQSLVKFVRLFHSKLFALAS